MRTTRTTATTATKLPVKGWWEENTDNQLLVNDYNNVIFRDFIFIHTFFRRQRVASRPPSVLLLRRCRPMNAKLLRINRVLNYWKRDHATLHSTSLHFTFAFKTRILHFVLKIGIWDLELVCYWSWRTCSCLLSEPATSFPTKTGHGWLDSAYLLLQYSPVLLQVLLLLDASCMDWAFDFAFLVAKFCTTTPEMVKL